MTAYEVVVVDKEDGIVTIMGECTAYEDALRLHDLTLLEYEDDLELVFIEIRAVN